ncbi:MAG TPA: signal peptidase I [Candidatus Limnocylindrales bacterium]|nr:signal peptidase I [Candidatus Limnocylindrales bacterium]
MIRAHLGEIVIIGLALAWYVVLGPTVIGGPATYAMVSGTSMEPLLSTGDLVVLRRADAYALGDLVAFHPPDRESTGGALVIHRIVGGTAATGFETRGDNNRGDDPWRPRPKDIAGKAAIVIPGAARVLEWARRPFVFAALAAGFAVFAILLGTSRSADKPVRAASTDPEDPAAKPAAAPGG